MNNKKVQLKQPAKVLKKRPRFYNHLEDAEIENADFVDLINQLKRIDCIMYNTRNPAPLSRIAIQSTKIQKYYVLNEIWKFYKFHRSKMQKAYEEAKKAPAAKLNPSPSSSDDDTLVEEDMDGDDAEDTTESSDLEIDIKGNDDKPEEIKKIPPPLWPKHDLPSDWGTARVQKPLSPTATTTLYESLQQRLAKSLAYQKDVKKSGACASCHHPLSNVQVIEQPEDFLDPEPFLSNRLFKQPTVPFFQGNMPSDETLAGLDDVPTPKRDEDKTAGVLMNDFMRKLQVREDERIARNIDFYEKPSKNSLKELEELYEKKLSEPNVYESAMKPQQAQKKKCPFPSYEIPSVDDMNSLMDKCTNNALIDQWKESLGEIDAYHPDEFGLEELSEEFVPTKLPETIIAELKADVESIKTSTEDEDLEALLKMFLLTPDKEKDNKIEDK